MASISVDCFPGFGLRMASIPDFESVRMTTSFWLIRMKCIASHIRLFIIAYNSAIMIDLVVPYSNFQLSSCGIEGMCIAADVDSFVLDPSVYMCRWLLYLVCMVSMARALTSSLLFSFWICSFNSVLNMSVLVFHGG